MQPLKPESSMPLWFYAHQRDYRFPIPTDFEFAYIDKSGAVVITGPFRTARPFINGRAEVEISTYELDNGRWMIPSAYAESDYRVLIDKAGKILEKCPSDKASSKLGRPPQERDHQLKGQKGSNVDELLPRCADEGGEWGYTDQAGRFVIQPQFDAAYAFSEGLAKVRKYDARGDNKNIAYINAQGMTVIPFNFEDGDDFSNGLAAVCSHGKWGFIDKSGKTVIPFQYESARSFSEGLAPVIDPSGSGFIDQSAKIVIPFKFADALPFKGGLAPATEDGINWGYIDKSGQFVIRPVFKQAFQFTDDRALVMMKPRQTVELTKKEREFFYATGEVAMNLIEVETAREYFKQLASMTINDELQNKARIALECRLPPHTISDDACRLYRNAIHNHPLLVESLIQECIEKYPDFDWPRSGYGYSLFHDGKLDEAERVLKDVLEKNPKFARAYIRLADVMRTKGDIGKADELIEQARALNPYDELLAPKH